MTFVLCMLCFIAGICAHAFLPGHYRADRVNKKMLFFNGYTAALDDFARIMRGEEQLGMEERMKRLEGLK